jgi:hypothetical protein
MLWEGRTEMRIDDLFEHIWELDSLAFLYREQFQLHRMSGVDSGEHPISRNAENRVRSKRGDV